MQLTNIIIPILVLVFVVSCSPVPVFPEQTVIDAVDPASGLEHSSSGCKTYRRRYRSHP
jgi:hypothetical protein